MPVTLKQTVLLDVVIDILKAADLATANVLLLPIKNGIEHLKSVNRVQDQVLVTRFVGVMLQKQTL